MPIGSSSQLKAGQQVIAIGNPAGAGENLVGTVTVGYVSAVNRELMFNGTRQKFIQTDAAINPGNSGGPLVDINGNVVGMITLKSLVSTSTVDAEGIGFAIPIDSAVEMAKEIDQQNRDCGGIRHCLCLHDSAVFRCSRGLCQKGERGFHRGRPLSGRNVFVLL